MTLLSALVFAATIQSGRAVWIDAESGSATPCEIDARTWKCPERSETARGILVVIHEDRVEIASAIGVHGVDLAPAQWGRLVRVEGGGLTTTDQHGLALTLWRPERSTVRTHLRRFRAVRDESVRALQLSATVFWLSGSADGDADAFLSLDGPDIGSVRVAMRRLREDAAEVPFVISPPMPAAIVGRVRNASGNDVAAARVDLLQPLRADPGQRVDADTPVIARASTTTDANGSFSFERMAEMPLLITASSTADGRGSSWVMNPGPPLVIELTPQLRARGRVLRGRIPLAAAHVRFVPSLAAWGASVDPGANLAEDSVSADDGVFEVALPDQPAGELQIVAADGATARVPIVNAPARTRTIELGDVAIPDPRRIVVRLLEPMQTPACDLLAIGPLDSLGMQTVRASSAVNVYTLDLPEGGQWTFSVECGGRIRPVAPTTASVPPPASDTGVPTIDLRFVR